jgi:hypothetical protein
MRGMHIHSMFPLGATSAVTSQSDRNANWAIGGNGEVPRNGAIRDGACFVPSAGFSAQPSSQR